MIVRCTLPLIVLILSVSTGHFCKAEDVFEKPVRLKADGKIIDTGDHWGHSSPCIEDIDGDKLDDLILGDFRGNFQIYKNVGRSDAPVYTSAGKVQADGKDAAVRIYCCVGGQPRFVDLNGDGIRDFISSSYDPGYCYFFRGLKDHKFAAPEVLKDQSGEPVQSAVKPKQNFQSFGSFYMPVDWDDDGDFDLLIGCFDGHLKLRMNEGTAKEYAFATENQTVKAGGKPLEVEKHCCPVVADWDQDGLWDLLAESDEGSVTWFKNVGSRSKPEFAAGEVLVPKHSGNGTKGYNLVIWNEKEITPGIRSQIEVVDYNRDGKLDLLLGDFNTAYDLRKDLTKQEKAEVEILLSQSTTIGKAYGDKMEALRADFTKRYPGDLIYSDKATKEWSEAYKKLRESPEAKELDQYDTEFTSQMRPYLASTQGKGNRSHDLAKSHGYVWLFLRK
ncbi:VCBS repeat-containing protein [Gimesia chilikensis]|uniref:FG-GAP repeat domain-containing protein n=1 Tax=Gimesia chilikensis TaxID=2605989 RepID=UPI0011ED78E9|nr:VCBS repeat-containing protein [Gimesia chilikensis]KAA0141533.1 VCBS repeat-containing protein [Gimesia chilikensis]